MKAELSYNQTERDVHTLLFSDSVVVIFREKFLLKFPSVHPSGRLCVLSLILFSFGLVLFWSPTQTQTDTIQLLGSEDFGIFVHLILYTFDGKI